MNTSAVRVDKTINAFYRKIVSDGQQVGIVTRFAGGQACLEYGIAEFTKDLDLIVAVNDANRLLNLLETRQFQGVSCSYRIGHGSPLASPWLDGGWTSHFVFPTGDPFLEPSIDVFAIPPRVLTPIENEPPGLLASLNTIAEMKKTRRLKDWGFVTSLGLKMLKNGDPHGLLHIFDADLLAEFVRSYNISGDLFSKRPVLALAKEKHPLLFRAVQTEIDFWSRLDRKRLQIYKNAWAGYFREVRKIPGLESESLRKQHAVQMDVAKEFLPLFPLQTYGIKRFFDEVRGLVMAGLSRELVKYLPNTSALERHLEQMS
ncbi:MAG: hypothetical protein E3J94_03365 [Desulfobacteraceae bacterium]|nr:MAG: hypothetical protein E3J94_03365 [Desulfobacteraceae bacterium]